MDDLLKIIRINAYIQRGAGDVLLDGKKVTCIALDNTCTCEDDEVEGERELSPEQIHQLFCQMFGFLKAVEP